MPVPTPVPAESCEWVLRVAGRDLPFVCFKTPTNQAICRDILEGRTYPAVRSFAGAKIIVDVGANVGASSVFFATHYPSASIFAFEPYPPAVELLTRNLAPFPRARVLPFGLADRDAVVPLYLGIEDAVTNSVAASAHNGGASVQIALRSARQALTALNAVPIDVLKIDTEGCELAVLDSLAELLPGVGLLYLEYHSEEDRLAIDARLRTTHILRTASVREPHRGELCYVGYSRVADRAALDRHRIPAR